LDLAQFGEIYGPSTFSGRLNEEKIKPIRDMWKGKLVIKRGLPTKADAESAINWDWMVLIVSNHGGRQLIAGESTIKPLTQNWPKNTGSK